jgi:hypothetical protein
VELTTASTVAIAISGLGSGSGAGYCTVTYSAWDDY